MRNACVNDGTPDSGHEERSVATLAEFLGGAGRVFEPVPGRQSVLYRVGGTDPAAPTLMLMGHIDVVPANPASWQRDPFAGERHGGFVWGRGAVDMLNLTAGMAVAFRPYWLGEKPPPPGGLAFLAAADEEAGGVLGVQHILETDPGALACDYLLTEIGMPHLPGIGGPGLPVTVAEKGLQWSRITASGLPGHASQPYRTDSALAPVAEAASRLAQADTPVDMSDEWLRFLKALDLDTERKASLAHPDRVDDAIAGVAAEDPGLARWMHACTHMTVVPTTLEAGTKANVIPDAASADVDVRVLPGQDRAAVEDHFRKVLGPALFEEVEIEARQEFPATGSAPAGPLWDALDDAHRTLRGEGSLIPALIPVGTDARFFRARGVVAYGVGLFDDRVSFGDVAAMYHGNDERVSERSLQLTAEFFAATVERFGELTAS